jgi:hypothetical protein
MFAEDKSRTHVDAVPAQIVGLFEATNQPLVQPPGGAAQAAQAVVVGVKGRRGIEVLIALTLTESGENLIYTLEEPVPVSKAQEAFDEAVVFAESMGFILDTTGWHSLDAAHREELIARLPAFREPSGGAGRAAEGPGPARRRGAPVRGLFARVRRRPLRLLRALGRAEVEGCRDPLRPRYQRDERGQRPGRARGVPRRAGR